MRLAMSSELVARAVLHRIADAQPEITLEDGAAVVTESVAIRAMEDFAERAFSDVETLRARLEALEAEKARLREVLEPFAEVAEHDIGDDETDDDIFWPISNARYSMSGRLRVGHLRAARRALEGGE